MNTKLENLLSSIDRSTKTSELVARLLTSEEIDAVVAGVVGDPHSQQGNPYTESAPGAGCGYNQNPQSGPYTQTC